MQIGPAQRDHQFKSLEAPSKQTKTRKHLREHYSEGFA